MRRQGRAGTMLAIVAAMAAGAARAATPLLISPTLVQLPPAGGRSATIEVTNQSDGTVDVQLRGYDWSQPAGEDVLAPSPALMISPAIATIPPHGRQVYRILDVGPPATIEKAFRIRINELPKSGATEAVAVNLEFLVPVFRSGEGPPPGPAWTRDAAGLVVANPGARHIRMTEVRVVAPDGAARALSGAGPIYLLAGAHRRFGGVPPAALRVTGASDGVAFDVALPSTR